MWLLILWLISLPLAAQTVCEPPTIFTPCDLVFELPETEVAGHPNPYLSVNFHA